MQFLLQTFFVWQNVLKCQIHEMESVMTQVCMQFKRPCGLWGPQRVNNPTDLPLGGAVAVNEWHSAALELVQGRRETPSSGQTLQDCAELVESLGGSSSSEVCDWRRKTESKNYQPGNVSGFRGEWHFFRGLEGERKNLCKPDKASENSQYPQRLRSCHWMCILGWMFYSVFVAVLHLL